MLGLKYAVNYPESLTKLIAGGAAASNQDGKDKNSIYCRDNPHYFIKSASPNCNIREQIKGIHIRSFTYSGKHDAQFPLKFGEEIAESIPGARFTVFNESNHNPFSEEESRFKEFVKKTL